MIKSGNYVFLELFMTFIVPLIEICVVTQKQSCGNSCLVLAAQFSMNTSNR